MVVTAGSEEKCRRCLELGADAAVDYRSGDFAAVAREVTGGHGVDVVLDSIGSPYLDANLAALATGGRLLLIGLMGFVWEQPASLLRMNLLDLLLVTYLGVFSSAMTFFLQQRATSVLTPGAVTAYSYLVPFVSMLLLFFDQPARMGVHWLPGSLLVVLAIGLLLRRDRQP